MENFLERTSPELQDAEGEKKKTPPQGPHAGEEALVDGFTCDGAQPAPDLHRKRHKTIGHWAGRARARGSTYPLLSSLETGSNHL